MKRNSLKILFLTLLLCPPLAALSGYGDDATFHETLTFQPEDAMYTRVLENDSLKKNKRPLFMIRVLTRTKGDSVILRWAPDEFAPWAFGNEWGYNVFRVDSKGHIDTLTIGLRPMPLEKMKQHFAPNDSLAGAAAQMLYRRGTVLDSAASKGSNGLISIYDEQQTRFAYAMLLAEIRPDLAEAMALKFVDRNVKKGASYKYVVGSAVPDSFLNIGTVPVYVKNVPYKAPHYNPVITDSIGMNGIVIYWPNSQIYSTHDIERRHNGGEWVKLNERPFITLTANDASAPEYNMYEDRGMQVGTYEYRVKGYDSFGETSNYSTPHKVVMPDLLAPTAPLMQSFLVDRDTPGKVYADIIWKKSPKEDDLAGFNVFYYNEKMGTNWHKLNQKMLSRNDTLFRCDVTHLGSGTITVAAVDTAGNFSPSTPYELQLSDILPPAAPTGLRYVMSPTGSVMISWNKNKESDVASYQLLSANDSTHTFTPMTGKLTSDTITFDTIAVRGVNQKYLYYALQAYDFSGNVSPMSRPLQVLRKNYDKPAPCRPDSAWQTDSTVHMRWFATSAADVDRFYVYRRIEGTQTSDLIQVLPADSIRNGHLYVTDSPQRHPTLRYYYGIRTTNTTGVSSDLSFEIPFLFKGATLLPIDITIDGTYRKDIGKIILGWKVGKLDTDILRTGYFCIYRKRKKDTFFRFLESVAIDQRTTTDRDIPAGESAEYKIRIRTSDGRLSPLSSSISVRHPANDEHK